MAKKAVRQTINSDTTKEHRQEQRLAALATLMGVMMQAVKLSEKIQEHAQDIGTSVEDLASLAGIDFDEVHSKAWSNMSAPTRKKRRIAQARA